MKRRARFYLILVLGVFIAFVLIDSLGAFDSKSWFEVPHGNHSHYLPKDCDPALAVGDAPTTKPRALTVDGVHSGGPERTQLYGRPIFTRLHGTLNFAVTVQEPLVRAGGYGIASRGPMRLSGNDGGPLQRMD